MVCASCGYNNLNDNAPFCGGCGRPLNPGASESSHQVSSSDKVRSEPRASRKLTIWIGGIASVLVLAIAGGGTLTLYRHHENVTRARTLRSAIGGSTAPASSSTNLSSTNSVSTNSSSTNGSSTNFPSGGVSSTGAASSGALSTTGTAPSQTANLVSLAMGGNVDKVSSEAGMSGFAANYLLDDLSPDKGSDWAGYGWAAEPQFPQEIVLSFFGHQPALIASVQITPVDGPGLFPEERAKDVEIWTSNESADAGFSQVARKTLAKDGGEETISFAPVQVRYVKIRVLSNYGSEQVAIIGKVRITEANGNGYVPLLQRNSDLSALAGGAPMEAVFKAGPPTSQVTKTSPDLAKQCEPTMAAAPASQNASRNVLVLEEGDNQIFDQSFNNFDEIRPWFDKGGKELVWKEPRWATPARLLNAEGFDTVVLSELCDIKTSVSEEFKRALVAWVMQGHKLIIRDSDGCVPGPDYSFLPYRFETNNVACGCEGHNLRFVEESSLGNSRPKDPSFLNLDRFAQSPNELGDSNVIVDWDSNWCGHMITTNANGVTGFVEAYAHLGRGLVIYDGFDHDNYGKEDYQRMFIQELEQPFDPDGLSCSSRIGHFIVTTDLKLQNQPASAGKTYTYPLTLLSNQSYKGDLKMSAASVPPDPSLSFHFDTENISLTGTSKTRLAIATTTRTPAIPRALEVRATDANGESNALCLQWTEVAAQPTAQSIKEELDKTGRAILYINFDFNKATIRRDGKPIINQVLKLLKDNPDLKLAINGYTDNVGNQSYNLRLSQERAAAVVAALVAAGISKSRLSSDGFGSGQPIADNSTEKGRAKNRRVELVKM